jgi:hypothetical protein
MPRRGSVRVSHTFEERLAAEKSRLETRAAKLQPGQQKDELLHKIAQLETAARLNDWLNSPGLQPPKSA